MAPTYPHGDDDLADYERLRDHLRRPPLEHPVPRQQPPAVAPASSRAGRTEHIIRISVVEWIFMIGRAVARRVRGAPRSPMVTIHPRE